MLLVLTLLGCTPYPGACEAYAHNYCDTCETEGIEDTWCKCIQDGSVEKDDFPDGYDVTNDEAEIQCDAWKDALTYPSPDSAASCKQSLALIQKHDNDVCDFMSSGSF